MPILDRETSSELDILMEHFDASVVGAGVVGTAIARELGRAGIRTALVEASGDVGMGTSKANTALLCTGFDADPDSLESRLVRRGYALLLEYGERVGIPIERTGGLLVAWNDEEMARLPVLEENARRNNVQDTRVLSREEVYGREPHLGDGALGGLLVPGESILCPFTPPLAFATEFKINGGTIFLNSGVEGISAVDGGFEVSFQDGKIESRWLINAAGLHSDSIDRMVGFDRYSVTPRRGQLIVFDKFGRNLLAHILLPVPTARTKGVIVSPTVFGNVLLGPTAEDLEDKTDTGTTIEGMDDLLTKGKKILPALMREEVTATYAGLRAATEAKDYQIHFHPELHYFCVGGIRSTGMSAALGISEYVVHQMIEAGLPGKKSESWQSVRMPYIGENGTRPYCDEEKISVNSDYGRIVCHCEKVSLGEIRDALNSELPPSSLDGLRRRTRCLLGRCQGFYCRAEIQSLLAGNLTHASNS